MWTAHDSADQLYFTPLYHFHQRVQSSFCFRNSQECQFSSWRSSSRSWQHVQHFNVWSRSTDSTTALPSAIMANFSTTWTPGLTPSRFVFRHCYFPKYPLDPVAMLQTFSVPFALSCLWNSIVFLMFRPPFVLSNKCSVANNPLLLPILVLNVRHFLSSAT